MQGIEEDGRGCTGGHAPNRAGGGGEAASGSTLNGSAAPPKATVGGETAPSPIQALRKLERPGQALLPGPALSIFCPPPVNSSVQSLIHVQFSVTLWTAACQACPSPTP